MKNMIPIDTWFKANSTEEPKLNGTWTVVSSNERGDHIEAIRVEQQPQPNEGIVCAWLIAAGAAAYLIIWLCNQ